MGSGAGTWTCTPQPQSSKIFLNTIKIQELSYQLRFGVSQEPKRAAFTELWGITQSLQFRPCLRIFSTWCKGSREVTKWFFNRKQMVSLQTGPNPGFHWKHFQIFQIFSAVSWALAARHFLTSSCWWVLGFLSDFAGLMLAWRWMQDSRQDPQQKEEHTFNSIQ